jgi:hypothetical protein
MADERMGLDTEGQRRRYDKAQLGELEKFAGAAMRDIQAAEARGEARGRAAVLAQLRRDGCPHGCVAPCPYHRRLDEVAAPEER